MSPLNGAVVFQIALALVVASSGRAQRVVIDPGHGGTDSGASVASGCRHGTDNEEVVNLETARMLADLLRARGIQVDMTRTGDTPISVASRVQFANSRGANLLLSIHANSNRGTPATGTETFRHTSQSSTSSSGLLASAVQREMLAAWGLTDRRAKTLNLRLLRETSIPAALVELGFMNRCDPDNAFLQSTTQRRRAAEALRDAIVARLNGVTTPGGGGDPEPPPDPSLPSCGNEGMCIDTGTTSCDGELRSGLCPGSTSIRCCQPLPTCGSNGRCIDTNRTSCDGTLRSGLCPGSSNIRCCEAPENLETLRGRVVRDSWLSPGIASATVVLSSTGARTTTDSRGHFSFQARAGSHNVQVSAVGYTSRTQSCSTGGTCEIELAEFVGSTGPPSGPTGRLVGVIYEGTRVSRRIPGATVMAAGQQTVARAGDAFFTIRVSPGDVTVDASGAGFVAGSRTCNVRANRDTWCSIGLSRIPSGRGGGSDGPTLEVVETDEPPEAAAADLAPLSSPPITCSASAPGANLPGSGPSNAPLFLAFLAMLFFVRRMGSRRASPLLSGVLGLTIVSTACNDVSDQAQVAQTQQQGEPAAVHLDEALVHEALNIGVAAHLEVETPLANGSFVDISIAPGADHVALSHVGYDGVSVLDLQEGYLQVVSTEARSGWMPKWTADGEALALRGSHNVHAPSRAVDLNGRTRELVPANSRVTAAEHEEQIAIEVDGEQTIVGPPGDRYYLPEVAPDDAFVSFFGLSTGLYLYRVADGVLFQCGEGTHARFDPEGRWLVFERLGDDGHLITAGDLYLVDLDAGVPSLGRIETGVDRIEHAPSLSAGRIAFLRDGVATVAELVVSEP